MKCSQLPHFWGLEDWHWILNFVMEKVCRVEFLIFDRSKILKCSMQWIDCLHLFSDMFHTFLHFIFHNVISYSIVVCMIMEKVNIPFELSAKIFDRYPTNFSWSESPHERDWCNPEAWENKYSLKNVFLEYCEIRNLSCVKWLGIFWLFTKHRPAYYIKIIKLALTIILRLTPNSLFSYVSERFQ